MTRATVHHLYVRVHRTLHCLLLCDRHDHNIVSTVAGSCCGAGRVESLLHDKKVFPPEVEAAQELAHPGGVSASAQQRRALRP